MNACLFAKTHINLAANYFGNVRQKRSIEIVMLPFEEGKGSSKLAEGHVENVAALN